uniref:Uncharacterized protein n=1 Tax=Arundo donax TaxID=35708 RepID=A0A0A9AFP9_ARUDO
MMSYSFHSGNTFSLRQKVFIFLILYV